MEVGSRNASANFQGSGIGKPAFKLYWRDKFCEDKNGEDFVESAPKRSKPVDVGFITPVKDLKRQFETFQLAAQKPLVKQLDNGSTFLKRKFEDDDSDERKISKDSFEKEDVSRKRRKRIEEFLADSVCEQGSNAKRRRVGTVYDTIKKYALSEDKVDSGLKRKVVTPTESYQILKSWINSRIKNYSMFVSQLSDLSTSTFSDGLVLASLAHSYVPFQLSFFSLKKQSRERRLTFAWETFSRLTGEEPVYSLEDALSHPDQRLDRKCLLTMLFLLREKLSLQCNPFG